MYLRPFDPWKSELCTCRQKFSLNPYTGCAHRCLYCYATSYIKDFFRCRPKTDLIRRLQIEVKKIPAGSLISLSNTSDPYPPLEKALEFTRKSLKILNDAGMKLLIITKGSLVLRDTDLLRENAAITMTVTTLKHFRVVEPYAPNPFERMNVLEKLAKEGIPTGLRVDPIIPFVNEDEVEEIIKTAALCGVKHIIASSFKPRWDGYRRLKDAFPSEAFKMQKLYFEQGQKIGNSWYLPVQIRKEMMLKVKQICDSLSLTFASCREGFPELNTAPSCDGSHLIDRTENFFLK